METGNEKITGNGKQEIFHNFSPIFEYLLYITPPVQKLERGTLESLGLCPSALVFFSFSDKSMLLLTLED